MDSEQIYLALSRNKETRKHFRGVYAIDEIELVSPDVGYYVLNLDPSHKPGSHWVAIDVKKGRNIYFDSYGIPPSSNLILNFLRGKPYDYNKRKLQHRLSTTCGQWCIYFIWRRSQKWSLSEILKPFYHTNSLINDHVLNIVLKKHFKIKNKVVNRKFIKKQLAKEMYKNLSKLLL